MLNWFRKNKKPDVPEIKNIKKVQMQPFEYPAKILLAWAKAVEGNVEIKKWLFDNILRCLEITKFKTDSREIQVQTTKSLSMD